MSGGRFGLIGPAGLAWLLVAACGTAPPASLTPDPTLTGAPEVSPTTRLDESPPEPTQQTGSTWTLSVAYGADISSLDPAIAYDIYSWPPIQALFDPLIGYAPDSSLVPLLAQEMPGLSSDGRTFTFTLREGAFFVSPDGQPLREILADDVVYSLNRILDPGLTPTPSPVAGTFFAQIEGAEAVLSGDSALATGIQAIDDHTVSITIVEPSQSFLNVLAMPFGSIVPREFASTDTAAFSEAPVGSGPYLLESYVPGDVLVLARNESYWNHDPLRPSLIEISMGVDVETQIQRVQTGVLDIAADTIPAGSYSATVNDPRWADQVYTFRGPAIDYLTMDASGDGPTANVDVRRAMNMAIDKQHLLTLQNNRGVVANCIYPPALPGHNPNCAPYQYQQDQARQLLSDAGYGDGFSTSLYTWDDPPAPEFAQAIQQDLGAIGIDVELQIQPFDTLLETISTPHNAPLVFIGWFQDFPDPSDFIDPLFTCAAAGEGGTNLSWYCNEEVDRLAAEARGEPDQARRLDLYQELEELIMQDAPIVPLRFPDSVYLISDRIEFGFHPIWTFDLTTPRLVESA